MNKLKIAIQKSGRLSEKSLELLKECGIEFNSGMDKLYSPAYNFPLEILYLRNSDIPQYIEDGVADIGILGENTVLEKKKNISIIERLGFGRCRLSIAVPKNVEYKGAETLQNLRIATSFPVILQDYLNKQNIKAEIHEISGSVEIAPGIGLADAVCDLVSSGSTLFSNNLKEVEVLHKFESVIVKKNTLDAEKEAILKKLLFRIKSVMQSKNNKYILLNAPNDKLDKVIELLPGIKSPTILPLAEEGWSSVHTVINENDFWEIIETLKETGAQGILVVGIEKMVI